ncbi:sugar phosphate isomerase/epimerase [Gramella sp. GC03-9]|uniref:Sugar phosphate isomerase/epimerase n=1 Tax=Christiangramia oceanisediminis TaxID=2920386 RepID=A0A9X2I554_9FLAO|nr:sugar phosphate isomerase/epimerase family protein [Gramella oceanisediminis]MCP9200065.1 sugar phosphate isomerase/epimerase [Gramella oceanisediminis]
MASTKYGISSLLFLFIIITSLGFGSCKNDTKKNDQSTAEKTQQATKDSLFFDISLAQWSLNRPIFAGELDPMDFAKKAHEMGFTGIEYVTGFYAERIKNANDPEAEMQVVLDSLKAKSERYNVKNLLLMVDGEGDMAVNDATSRDQAVENHKKWVDAAQFLGCHSIRVNLFGATQEEEWKKAATDALTKLSKYAAGKNVNVLVENHGQLSSNADLLLEVIEAVNMENCGTLPDFGNFCIKREGGERWEAKCIEEYPKYEGVQKMMAHAKAVSAKSYSFDDQGEEEVIDYRKMLEIIKDAGYTGYIGIEFEGTEIPAEEGIMATKDLLIQAGRQL